MDGRGNFVDLSVATAFGTGNTLYFSLSMLNLFSMVLFQECGFVEHCTPLLCDVCCKPLLYSFRVEEEVLVGTFAMLYGVDRLKRF